MNNVEYSSARVDAMIRQIVGAFFGTDRHKKLCEEAIRKALREIPGFDLTGHLHRQRAFSEGAFGPGARTRGVIAHIRKELLEIEANPGDVTEWIDVALLAFDGAWRAGHEPEAIAAALNDKQSRNEARSWPDWRTAGEDAAIEHVEAGELRDLAIRDLTIRELQTQLPWTVHYHRDFRSSPMAHKDFGHALLHVLKAAGKLAAIVNDAEHGGSEFKPDEVDRYVADLVVCALRMATTCPGRQIDLQRCVEDRIEQKNDAELQKVPQ